MTLDVSVLTGPLRSAPRDRHTDASYVVVDAGPRELAGYRRLRHDVFVTEQGLFAGSDADVVDDDPRTVVLVALARDGEVLGGVRIHPAPGADGAPPVRDVGWWRGSRLAVASDARLHLGVGAALARAACARAETQGALRFDAEVQAQHRRLFERLGWSVRHETLRHGHPHLVVDFPITRIQRLADATKAPLGLLLDELAAGAPRGFVGDDAAPVLLDPAVGLVAAAHAQLAHGRAQRARAARRVVRAHAQLRELQRVGVDEDRAAQRAMQREAEFLKYQLKLADQVGSL